VLLTPRNIFDRNGRNDFASGFLVKHDFDLESFEEFSSKFLETSPLLGWFALSGSDMRALFAVVNVGKFEGGAD
jgi:hypothetical protein